MLQNSSIRSNYIVIQIDLQVHLDLGSEGGREGGRSAVQDTLSHNANLAMWRSREGLSSACTLCGRRQTLLHVLNNCPKALNLHRYNKQHDAVLEVISKFMAESLPDGYQLLADLPQSQPYIFPPHIATTDQRPDIVVWSNTAQEVWVIELTVCFETGYERSTHPEDRPIHRPHETHC